MSVLPQVHDDEMIADDIAIDQGKDDGLDDDSVDDDDGKDEDDRDSLARIDQYKDRMQDDLLFNIQGVGSIKKINGYDVYVKNKDCETSLNCLYRTIKNDSAFDPWVKETLGRWKFLQHDLLPLLTFHKKDRKLSFLACRIIVQLTEYPRTSEDLVDAKEKRKVSWTNAKSKYRHQMLEVLRGYKESFLQPQVVAVLMEHLADCLQEKEMTQKHEQMVELIIVLFKQLLQIPDPKSQETNTDFAGKHLQKRLLLLYHDEQVLDSFNYLSQDFTNPLNKMLCMHILEIQYQIFKNFTPEQIFITKEKELEAKQKVQSEREEFQNTRKFLRSTRPGKFGTQIQVTRPDGTRVMLTNLYQKHFDVTNLGKHQ